jgi:hypothetical protein
MASKAQTVGGEVTIFDPGDQQGRIDSKQTDASIEDVSQGFLSFSPVGSFGPLIAPGHGGILFTGVATPEGLISAPPGTIAVSLTGAAFLKVTGQGNTGWIAFNTGSGATVPQAGGLIERTGLFTGLGITSVAHPSTGVYEITLDTPQPEGTSLVMITPAFRVDPLLPFAWNVETPSDDVRRVRFFDVGEAALPSDFYFALFVN